MCVGGIGGRRDPDEAAIGSIARYIDKQMLLFDSAS